MKVIELLELFVSADNMQFYNQNGNYIGVINKRDTIDAKYLECKITQVTQCNGVVSVCIIDDEV